MVGKYSKRIALIGISAAFVALVAVCVVLGLINDKRVAQTPMYEVKPRPVETVNKAQKDSFEMASVEEKPYYSAFQSPDSYRELYVQSPDSPFETIEKIQKAANYEVVSVEYTVCADELVEWAFRAYNEEWEYVYAGCEEGHVDCSGLIKSCVGICARGTEELLAESELKGEIGTIPDIPGLGVYMPGHVGIYVGGGMVIDARTEDSGVGYDAVDYEGWTDWFEIKGVDYSKYTVDFE